MSYPIGTQVGNGMAQKCNKRLQELAAKVLRALPRTQGLNPRRYQLYELTEDQHDRYGLRPCELCAFGRVNRSDGQWCGAELFMKCLHLLGRLCYFLRDTKEARREATNRIRQRIVEVKKKEHTWTHMRDPFDHHDPDYDENWLENNIDNPTFPDYD